jgi:hypothetical protein
MGGVCRYPLVPNGNMTEVSPATQQICLQHLSNLKKAQQKIGVQRNIFTSQRSESSSKIESNNNNNNNN